MKTVVTICCGAEILERRAFFFRGEPYCQHCGPAIVEQDLNAWNRICAPGGGHLTASRSSEVTHEMSGLS